MASEFESGFFYKDPAWHGLGKVLDHVATAEEAMKAADLNWDVTLEPVYVAGTLADRWRAIVRDTDKRVYGMVKQRYVPIQNRQAFDFFDGVVGGKQAIYHTAGSLRSGACVWILARLENALNIRGEQVDKYICLVNSHDGSTALSMFLTPIRVVCSNTLAMARSAADANKFYSKHTAHFQTKANTAAEILGITTKYFEQWTEQANYLAMKQLPAPQYPLLLAAAYQTEGALASNDVLDFDLIRKQKKDAMETVGVLLKEGRGMDNPAIQGTAWAAYNAIAEQVDYYAKPRKGDADNRLNSVWFGSSAYVKQRAWDFLLKV